MKLISPSFEIILQKPGIDGMLKHIELCGRVAYKSEDKITEDSAKNFVQMLVNRGHQSVLEHGTVYLMIPLAEIEAYRFYAYNPYSFIDEFFGSGEYLAHVITNYRVLTENNLTDHLKWLDDVYNYEKQRITVRFITSRAIANEFVRHRGFSPTQESTRFCNYSIDKFNNEVGFVRPSWLDTPSKAGPSALFKRTCQIAEDTYLKAIEEGALAQEARDMLPLCTKTELIMTGTIPQWKDFFVLRDSKAAHPDAKFLAHGLKEEFIKRGYIHDGTDSK